MSATNRGAKRIAGDAYSTPQWCIDGLKERMHVPYLSTFLEPCRGARSMIYNSFATHRRLWCEIAQGTDYLSWRATEKINIIATNPPYKLAREFLEKSLTEAPFVAYLVRLGFLASQKRKPFWLANKPTHTVVLSERPVFAWHCKKCGAMYDHLDEVHICTDVNAEGEVCGGAVVPGTDASDYAWIVFDRAGYMLTAPGYDWI